MLCQICKERDASFHYTKIINGEVEELHLCEECSKNKNELEFDKTFSFHKLLTEIIDGVQDSNLANRSDKLYCEKCNLTYREFKQLGKLGCDECYKNFEEKLLPLIKSIQGNEEHIGKIPSRASEGLKKERELDRLKYRLEEAIAEEKFEDAAIFRDEIRALEEDMKKEGD